MKIEGHKQSGSWGMSSSKSTNNRIYNGVIIHAMNISELLSILNKVINVRDELRH